MNRNPLGVTGNLLHLLPAWQCCLHQAGGLVCLSTVLTALLTRFINFIVLWSVPQHSQKLRHRVFTDEQRLSARLPSVLR